MTVQPGKEKAPGDFIHVYKYLMGENKVDRPRLFPVVLSDSTRGHLQKKNFFCRGEEFEVAQVY